MTNPREQLCTYMRPLISLDVLILGLVMHRLTVHVTCYSVLKTATCLFPRVIGASLGVELPTIAVTQSPRPSESRCCPSELTIAPRDPIAAMWGQAQAAQPPQAGGAYA